MVWLNPDPRGIIPLQERDGLHLPRRLMQRVHSQRFAITSDVAFEEVMRGCALPRPREPVSWIDERIIAVYTALHDAGHAHSIEAWLADDAGGRVRAAHQSSHGLLVGGLYGVHIGSAFFAESKFHRADLGGTDASKVCLAHLVLHLRRRGFAVSSRGGGHRDEDPRTTFIVVISWPACRVVCSAA